LRVGDKEINTNGICVPKKRVGLLWKIIKRNWSKMLVEVWMVKDKGCIP
jgi:hypothetical protein